MRETRPATQRYFRMIDWMLQQDNLDDCYGESETLTGDMQGFPSVMLPRVMSRLHRVRMILAKWRSSWPEDWMEHWKRQRPQWAVRDDELMEIWRQLPDDEIRLKTGHVSSDDSETESLYNDDAEAAEDQGQSSWWHAGPWWSGSNWWDAWQPRKESAGAASSSAEPVIETHPWAAAAMPPPRETAGVGISPRAAAAAVPEAPQPVLAQGPAMFQMDALNYKDHPITDTMLAALCQLPPELQPQEGSENWMPLPAMPTGVALRNLEPRLDGRFAWNHQEAKPLKHAYRTEGEGPVRWVHGNKAAPWRELMEEDGMHLGHAGYDVKVAFDKLVAWIHLRPALREAIVRFRLVPTTLPLMHSGMEGIGHLFYFDVAGDGLQPFVHDAPEGWHYGFHATSMYCLQRVVAARELSSGPGQLTDSMKAPAVYYHVEKFCRLCLGTYNHYIAVGNGPWFFCPILALDCRTILTGDCQWRKTRIRGQGLTYSGQHRIRGFFLHMFHAAEHRFRGSSDFVAIMEATWKPVLEIPPHQSWEDIVQEARARCKEPLL